MLCKFFKLHFLIGLVLLAGAAFILRPDAVQAAELGGNAYFDKVFYDKDGSFTDNTQAAQNETANDVKVLENSSSEGSYYGMQALPFNGLRFKMGTWGVGSGSAKYEYSTASGWSLLNVQDTGGGFLQISADNLATITFTPPSDWVKKTVNQVNGYWVRIRVLNGYDNAPFASQVRADVLNAKVQISTAGGAAWTDNLAATIGGDCGGYYGGEWNAGGGVHYYALKTTGGACTLGFNKAGYVSGSTYFANLTTTLSDFGSLIMNYATQVYVQDEMGNTLANAQVLFNGLAPAETGNGNYHFASNVASKRLDIRAIGYLVEDGSGYNTALLDVSGGTSAEQTFVRLIPNTPACNGFIAAGSFTSCGGLRRNTSIIIMHADGQLLPVDASVTFKQGGVVANDLSKLGVGDAQTTVTAGTRGYMAMQEGNYTYTITASGYNDAMGSFSVTEYASNNLTVMLTAAPQPDTTVSAGMSIMSISPATVTADNTSYASLGVTAKNAAGEVLSGKTVTVSSSLNGSSVSPASAVTDAVGRANFSVKSSAVGTATLTIVAGGVTLTAQPIVQFTAQGQQADTTVSASQSTIAFSPTSQSVPADGSSVLTLTVTAKNASGTVLANKNVTLGGDLTGITVSPASATTGANGQAVFTFKSSTVKTTAITITAGGVALTSMPTIAFTSTSIDQTVSASNSYAAASPSSITANGIQTSQITVIIRNPGNIALSGKQVFLSSSFGATVISPAFGITDSLGVATFTVQSSSVGTAQFTATVGNVAVDSKPTVQFMAAIPSAICQNPIVVIGSLVKLQDDGNPATQEDSAVYYYGKDCKRHAFPNDKVYLTWYTDFNAVTIIGLQTLAAMPLGKNVTYRPGIKMVKFTTLNNVYAVSKGGVLRWVKTEGVATSLYGATWNKKIDDISDAFFINYVFGSDIAGTADYNVNTELTNSQAIDDTL